MPHEQPRLVVSTRMMYDRITLPEDRKGPHHVGLLSLSCNHVYHIPTFKVRGDGSFMEIEQAFRTVSIIALHIKGSAVLTCDG